jgi:uncharacterized protein YndB with AHSA1/START domain
MTEQTTKPAVGTITLERRFRASLDRVWDLWTTKSGIERWWGPEGFEVEVTSLELHPGGELAYVMRATAPDQVAFMQQAGMPVETPAQLTYTAVEPKRLLAYRTRTDFVPGVEPYDVNTSVELNAMEEHVQMVLTFDPMHDEEWTRRMTQGHEGQLDKLDELLR